MILWTDEVTYSLKNKHIYDGDNKCLITNLDYPIY
jgi:hypothetical protein